jgi:thioredoxin reductase (NADPH)
MYDIIIIGAGPAGLTAALYALRADKKVLVLEKENFGGQITFSPKMENYPTLMQVSGNDFAQMLLDQVITHGADIELAEATRIVDNGEKKLVICDSKEFEGKSVIIAAGSKHRQLGLPNENELIGEGVSYCAVCDGAFFSGQRVAIVGGGNTALQEAVMLSDICESVTVIQNLPYLTGEGKLISSIAEKNNVSVIYNTLVCGLIGDKKLQALALKNTVSGAETELYVDGVFVAIGQKPENEPFADVAPINQNGYIVASENCLTKTAGVFVAGDCRTKEIRQVTTATADGAVAALAACRYIDGLSK